MCGENKKAQEEIFADLTEFLDEEGLCTNVVISDRFTITAAHCLEHNADR